MAVQVQAATAGIDLTMGLAAPRATPDQGTGDVLVANLTRGFNAIPRLMQVAFRFDGHVNVALGASDTLNNFKFGFVQFMRHNAGFVEYVGRTAGEGNVLIDYGKAIGSSYLLDISTTSTQRPFFFPPNNDLSGDETDDEVFSHMGDHPFVAIQQVQHNFKTGVDNFLFKLVDDRDAWSIFLMQGPTGAFTSLAHVHWFLHYEFTFQWRSRSIREVANGSRFRNDPVVQGAPTDPAIRKLLSTLSATTSPLANEVGKQALRTSVVNPNPNRIDSDGDLFFNAPADFFK